MHGDKTAMSDPNRAKEAEHHDLETKDYRAPAAQTTNHSEPLDIEYDEKTEAEVHRRSSEIEQAIGIDDEEKGTAAKQRQQLDRAKSYATTASAVSGVISVEDEEKKKKWHQKLNPLKWGKIRPVPDEREVSREYHASFLSLLYFQWMSPIMSVSTPFAKTMKC